MSIRFEYTTEELTFIEGALDYANPTESDAVIEQKGNVHIMTTQNAEKIWIPITAPQALSSLNITDGDRVCSFWTEPYIAGANLEFTRVEEMVKRADEAGKLFLINELGGALRHDIIAWNFKCQKWIYLECIAEKTERLRRDIR